MALWFSTIVEYFFYYLKISFWECSFITNTHNQKPIDTFNKQDVTVYLTYINILKY